jgi:hypothetical protein
VFGDPFEPVPQSGFEAVDRFARGSAPDLNTDEPTVDIEVGLRDHRPLQRRIAMPGQFDAGVEHRFVGKPTQPADLVARIICCAGKLTMGGHVDVEDGRQFGFVPHGLVVTPSFIHLTGPKVTERWAMALAAPPAHSRGLASTDHRLSPL